jgi:hypothetical protein
VLIVAFAGRLVGEAGWSLPLTFEAIFLLLSATALGEIWVCKRVAVWIAGLARQIRRALLGAWVGLEPAARPEVEADSMVDAVSATPRGMARLITVWPSVAFSLLTTLGCMATTLLVTPAAGAALVLAVKLAAVARIALLQRRAHEPVPEPEGRISLQTIRAVQAVPQPENAAVLQTMLAAAAPRRARQNAGIATNEALDMAARPALAIVLVIVTRLSGAEPVAALSMMLVALLLPLDWVAALPLIAQLSAATDRLAVTEAKLLAAARRWPEPAIAPAPVDVPFTGIALQDAMLRYAPHPGVPGTVIGPLSCRAAPGEITLILGGPLVGKSSALRMLSGLVRLDSGTLHLNGETVDPVLCRDRVWLVPSDPVLLAGQAVPGIDRAEMVELRRELGLDAVAALSSGFLPDPASLGISLRARLALLLAFASDRPALLLDEPGLWLDHATRARLFQTILPRLRDTGRAIVLTATDDRLTPMANTVVHLDGFRQDAA